MNISWLEDFAKRHGIAFDDAMKTELANFDPRDIYRTNKQPLLSVTRHRIMVGKCFELLVRMQDRGATREEMVRAFKHLLVAVDAQKHLLDYKQSEKDQGIQELREKYEY